MLYYKTKDCVMTTAVQIAAAAISYMVHGIYSYQ